MVIRAHSHAVLHHARHHAQGHAPVLANLALAIADKSQGIIMEKVLLSSFKRFVFAGWSACLLSCKSAVLWVNCSTFLLSKFIF